MHNVAYRGGADLPSTISSVVRREWSDDLLERLPVGVCICDRDGRLVQYNQRAAELWGRLPNTEDASERLCGSFRLRRPDGTPLPHDQSPMSEVLRTAEPVRDRSLVIERPDGTQVLGLVNIDPLFDEAGELVGAVNCFQDITALKRAADGVRARESRLRELLDVLPAAIYTTDADGRVTYFNQAAVELTGRQPELGTDQWCVAWRLYHADGRPMPHETCPMAVVLQENRPIRGAEAVAERPDGTRFPFIPYPMPLRDESGALVGAVNMLVDISERKEAETRQKALLDELNHRVKNTLATVQSLAAQTIRGTGIAKEVRDAFESRLIALSRAHNQLTQESWESADLKAIIDDLFAPYRHDDGARVRLQGDSVRLAPQAALTLAMVLHELSTNAAKYGALSAAHGTLDLSWQVVANGAGQHLRIEWQEAGGPPVEPPQHRGFGSRLVERAIVHELRGRAQLDFAPSGVHCAIDIPLSLTKGE